MIRKTMLALATALTGLFACADTPAALYAAIGAPSGVTVASSSDWIVASDSGLWSSSAKSSNHTDSTSSSLVLQASGANWISFQYCVNSESYDKLFLYIDGEEIKAFPGDYSKMAITTYEYKVKTTGSHTIEFRYTKDSSTSTGKDACWVANVSWASQSILKIGASTTKIAAQKYKNNVNVSRVEFEPGSMLEEIGDEAFMGCTTLETIVLPEGLRKIGDRVFDGCTSLKEIVFPSTLESLGTIDVSTLTAMGANFGPGYWVLSGWVIGYQGVCPSVIPEEESVRGFAKGALEGNIYFESFAPGTRNLVGISDSAFRHCFALKYVEFPISLRYIGSKAFEGCTQLEEVAIPGSVQTIDDYAFRYCYGLQYLAIASGVTKIGTEAFYDDYLLCEVDIPATVSSIGDNAFGGDSSLIRVGVRGDIKVLSAIFSNYQYLREVTVKPGFAELKDGLFKGCGELEVVLFLSTSAPVLENKGVSLFENTRETLTVYVPNGSVGWVGIEGAYGLPQAWPKNDTYTSTIRRSIAYWNVPSYLVEFDSNGGSLGVQATYQKPETAFKLPPEPVQSGYTFAGWWTSPVEGWQVTEETIFLEGVYTKLYAHWTRPHKIFLNANGGTVTNSTVTLVEQTTYGVLPAPVRTGYAFGGWTYKGETVVPSTKIQTDADHTLTAQWQAYRYSVHFNPNGGTGSVIAQQFKYDTLQSLDKCRYTRAGYTFVGWATSATGAVVYTDGQMVKNLTALQGGIVNLYAKWTRNYTIVFHKGDGSEVKSSYAFPYGVSTRLPAIKNGLHWERPGFKFKGWATSEANAKAGTVWKADWALVASAAAGGATLNVWGVWELLPGYYGIRYNKYDGSGAYRVQAYKYGDTSHLASIRYGLSWSKKGFTFKGWSTTAANATAGTIWKGDWGVISTGVPAGTILDVYASWKVDSSAYYAIKFMKNDGGSGWRLVGFEHGVDTHLPTCKNGLGWTRAGYTFKGWATSAANATAGKLWKADYAIVAAPVNKGATLTVYAVWQKNASSIERAPVAPMRATVASAPSASATAPSAELLTGTLADRPGTFRLLVYANGTGYVQLEDPDGDSRCLVCEVTDLEDVLVVLTEDGETYHLIAE